MENKLQTIIDQSGLQPAQAKPLLDSFGDYFVQAHKLVTKSKAIKVTSEDQIEEMQQARELRLELKNLRVEADKTRETLKEGYLRGGNAVQAIYNDIRDIIKPEEDRLMDQEKFAERLQEERNAKIEAQRISQLSQYVDDLSVYSLHPDKLSTDSFSKLLETSKIAYEAKKEIDRKAEEARLAHVEADRKEQERIRKENEQLRKEAQEKERLADIERQKQAKIEADRQKELAKERAEQQKKLDAEREKREKIEAEIAAQKQAQELAKKQEEEAQRQALLAPDKIKLLEFAKVLQSITAPAVKTREADLILDKAMEHLAEAIDGLQNGAKRL